jgi:hypothetical protein
MRRTLSIVAASGVLAAGLGLSLAAQQKPAAGAQPKVSVYKSPT